MEEKTVDQLEAEYKQLLQEKLDAAHKEKEAQELAARKEKEKAEYEEEFKKKYNLTAVSRLERPAEKPVEKPTNMLASPKEFQQFAAGFARHKGLPKVKGRSYKELLDELVSGEFRKEVS